MSQGHKIQLYPHQKKALSRVLKEPYFALFMEQGTGKTAVAIKAIEKGYKAGRIHRVLIFVPNTIVMNWEIELQQFLDLPDNSYVIETLSPKKREKRVQALNNFLSQDLEFLSLKKLKALGYTGKKKEILKKHKPKLMILLTNYEKSWAMEKEIKRFNPHMLILDESQWVKERTTQTAKSIYRMTRKCDYRLLLTGTPIVNGYEDLFMQYQIMDQNIFGSRYADFEDQYIVKGGYMGYDIVGYQNEDELKEIIKDTSFRVRLRDCVDLPPISYRYITCELNKKAQKAYSELDKEMLTQLEQTSSEISRKELKRICRERGIEYGPRESYSLLLMKASPYISNITSCELAITKIMRLQQISGGFITLDSGEVVCISKDKLQLAIDEVNKASRPVVIFCQYIPEIEMIHKELSKLKRNGKKLRVESFRDTKKRTRIYKQFQEGKIDVLVLQIQSGSVGLNLQRSNKLIFYSWSFSSEKYVQAISRIERAGQKNPMEVVHLIAEGTKDMEILEAIRVKRKIAKRALD